MNSERIFGLALGIEKPWAIEKVSLQKNQGSIFGQLDIHINFERGQSLKMNQVKLIRYTIPANTLGSI